MKVAISGASGLVGHALVQHLRDSGHEPYALVRHEAKAPNEIRWNPLTGELDASRLSQMDAVVHLAGESIANKRWTAAQKEKIRSSRVDATGKLCQSIAKCSPRPQVLITASAIGIYGDRGAEELTEASAPGKGFLAQVCRDWEDATKPAEAAGLRVVHGRISMVLSKEGGALDKLLPIFQLGGGGPIGSGKQYMSWIDLSDLVRALTFLLTADVSGPVNLAAPNPVTNNEFTRTLGKAVSRPAFLPVPPLALKILMGELADELLLSSQRVVPTVLRSKGFQFQYPELHAALNHVLGKGESVGGYAAKA